MAPKTVQNDSPEASAKGVALGGPNLQRKTPYPSGASFRNKLAIMEREARQAGERQARQAAQEQREQQGKQEQKRQHHEEQQSEDVDSHPRMETASP